MDSFVVSLEAHDIRQAFACFYGIASILAFVGDVKVRRWMLICSDLRTNLTVDKADEVFGNVSVWANSAEKRRQLLFENIV